MIKFTDVCKASLRYWYVMLICVVVMFSVCFSLTPINNVYRAVSTIEVDKSADATSKDYITGDYVQKNVVPSMINIVKHIDFSYKVVDKIGETDKAFADELKANIDANKKFLLTNLNVKYNGGSFFCITYDSTDSEKATKIVDATTELLMIAYNEKPNSISKFKKWFTTESDLLPKKTVTYSIIGVFIGLFLGIILVTFFIVLNPWVENRELVEKETGICVLAELEKRGAKDETENN